MYRKVLLDIVFAFPDLRCKFCTSHAPVGSFSATGLFGCLLGSIGKKNVIVVDLLVA